MATTTTTVSKGAFRIIGDKHISECPRNSVPAPMKGRFAGFETLDHYVRKHLISTGYLKLKFVPPHRRHSARLTFGLELEMVLEGYSEGEGFEVLLNCFRDLYLSGGIRYDAEIPDKLFDRTKFLIMPDNSINHRIKLKEGIEIPVVEQDLDLPAVDDSSSEIEGWDWSWGGEEDANTNVHFDERAYERRENLGTRAQQQLGTQPDQVKIEKKFSDLDSLADSCFELGAAVEFCTPILGQITYGSTLRSLFKHISQELKCHYNNSTGLHVHLGCGKGSSWSLEELKVIAKATILWEVVVDLMHAPHRGKGNWMIASNRWNPALRDLTLVEAFERIDKAYTLVEFYEQIGPEKFFKYNFIANSKYGTIEFRQAEAYGDGEKAVAWVQFLSGFVSAALTVARWEWMEWAEVVGVGETPVELLKLDKKVWKRFGISMDLVSSPASI
ncbi:hypothetical protein BDD12DRAFT_982216 [Trichophaea hybrida]|nr:hypothetical protein BDD12DRAFT_982216 [Trichophaea hybrida]